MKVAAYEACVFQHSRYGPVQVATAAGDSPRSSGASAADRAEDGSATREILTSGGWTLLTAVSVMLFSLIHNPCSTTIYTIWKETRSAKWTAVSALLPLVMGFDPLFHFIHERDAAEAIVAALSQRQQGVYNVVGPGEVPLHSAIREVGRTPCSGESARKTGRPLSD